MAVGADVANLRVAHRADDEIAVDGRATRGTGAVVLQLVLAQGDLELLLVAIDGERRGAQDEVGDEADERDDGDDAPSPPHLGATRAGVLDDVGDREQVEHHDGDADENQHHAHLRREDQCDELLHLLPFRTGWGVPRSSLRPTDDLAQRAASSPASVGLYQTSGQRARELGNRHPTATLSARGGGAGARVGAGVRGGLRAARALRTP